MTKEFDLALKYANDGGFRSKKEAQRWAVDFILHDGLSNHDAGVEAANLLEAERKTDVALIEIDVARCCELKEKLYLVDHDLALMSCRRDPKQLESLEETDVQLAFAKKMVQFRMKNRTEFYNAQEAEPIARAELGLPKLKAGIAGASGIPDVYGKSQSELAKLATDTPSKTTGIPYIYGKTKEQVKEAAEKL